MIRNTNRKAGIRWWAAIGAPAIGIPVLVGIMAVVAPRNGSSAETGEPPVAESALHGDLGPCESDGAMIVDGVTEPVSFDG